MKNRYKALIIVLSFIALIAVIAIIIGFGFNMVRINQFGYSRNKVFGTINDQNVFTVGRYFVGADHEIVKFPSGLLKYELKINCNTVDKSFITVEALFLGQFIPSELAKLNLEYGRNYDQMLAQAIELSIRETLQQFTLIRILSRRTEIQGQVSSRVQKNIEGLYPFIKCRLLSLGAVGTDLPNNATLNENPALYELTAQNLNQSYQLQKQINFMNVGADLLRNYELFHSEMFFSVMNFLSSNATGIGNLSNAAMYLMSDPIVKGMELDKVRIKI